MSQINLPSLVLLVVAIVAITALAIVGTISGDAAVAFIAGAIGGSFVPSPVKKLAE